MLEYYRPPVGDRLLTLCVLSLRNGFKVVGESACASPATFNTKAGERYARENAIEKIWKLEGYLLKEKLHQSVNDRTPEVLA